MNFLQIVQRLHSEASASGSAPGAVTSQTGEAQRLINWVSTAYEDIQNIHAEWDFLRFSFGFSATVGVQSYSHTAVSLTEWAKWKISADNCPSGVTVSDDSSYANEHDLEYVEWEEFKRNYQFGPTRTQTGKPTIVSVDPAKNLVVWPIPDNTYYIAGEYFKRAQTLTSSTDEPIIPSQYHMILVWRALMLYAAYLGAPDTYAHGNNEYRRILSKLENNQLPEITFGDTLA
jgi:hypothetical protein